MKYKNKDAVLVAKDVLKLLDKKIIKAEKGTYLDYSESLEERVDPEDYWSPWQRKQDLPADLKTYLHKLKPEKACRVCAIGSCFLARVYRKNEAPLEDFSRAEMQDALAGVFSENQLALIETAFEMSFSYQNANTGEDAWNAIEFGRKYATEKGRLRAIMNNIIANGGEFVPPAKKHNPYRTTTLIAA